MKKFAILYTLIFAAYLGVSMSMLSFTTMTLNLEESILPQGASMKTRTAILGVMMGMYPFGQFFGAPILGALSDKFGRRKMLILSLLISTCTYGVVALSIFPFNIHLLGVALLVTGFFEGNVVIAQSSIADFCPPEKRTTAFGYVSVAASTAFVVGPLVGSFLSNSSLVSWFNFATPFWMASCFFLLLTLWVMKSLPESLPEERRENKSLLQAFINLREIVTEKSLNRYYVVNLLLYLGVFGFFRLIPQFMVNHFALSHSMLCFSMLNLDLPVALISLFFIKPIVSRFSRVKILGVSALILALGIVLVIGLDNFMSTWFTMYFVAIGIAYVMPVSTSLISTQVPEQKQGSVLGNNTSLIILSQLCAVLISVGFTHIHVHIPLMVAVAMLLIASLLIPRLKACS